MHGKKPYSCTITFCFRKSCRFWVMWKDIAERGRPHMVTWRMRIACWLTKVTNIIIIIIFLHGLVRLTCSGIDALPSFHGASTIPFSPGFVGEGIFRESVVVHSFEVVDLVLFIFQSHVLYSRDLQFLSYVFASYFVQSCVSCNTS